MTNLRVCNKTFLSITPSPPSGTTGCNSDCLSVTREVKTSISTHIKWYKGPATHVTDCLLHRSHSFFPHCCDNYKLLWPIKQAYNSCSDLYPLRLVGKKNEKLLSSLICPSSFLPLNNYCIVNIWNQPHWWPVWWSINLITTLTCTSADIITLLSPFPPSRPHRSSRPTLRKGRRLWYSRAQVELLVRWNRCDLHTGHSWQQSDPEEAISHLPPFNICPRAVP